MYCTRNPCARRTAYDSAHVERRHAAAPAVRALGGRPGRNEPLAGHAGARALRDALAAPRVRMAQRVALAGARTAARLRGTHAAAAEAQRGAHARREPRRARRLCRAHRTHGTQQLYSWLLTLVTKPQPELFSALMLFSALILVFTSELPF